MERAPPLTARPAPVPTRPTTSAPVRRDARYLRRPGARSAHTASSPGRGRWYCPAVGLPLATGRPGSPCWDSDAPCASRRRSGSSAPSRPQSRRPECLRPSRSLPLPRPADRETAGEPPGRDSWRQRLRELPADVPDEQAIQAASRTTRNPSPQRSSALPHPSTAAQKPLPYALLPTRAPKAPTPSGPCPHVQRAAAAPSTHPGALLRQRPRGSRRRRTGC